MKHKLFPFLLILSFFSLFMVNNCGIPPTVTPEPNDMQESQIPPKVTTELSPELPTELLTEVPTEVRTETPVEATSEEPTETPESTTPPTPSITSTDPEKKAYSSEGIWAMPPNYLEFSLDEMSVSTIDEYFSSDNCFCEDHDPLQNKLHIVFNQCKNIKSMEPKFSCLYKMDKNDIFLFGNFFSAPIMRLIFYAEIDPMIPTQSGKQSFTTKSEFVAKINCSSTPNSSYYYPTTFTVGNRQSYYITEEGRTFIGPEHSTNDTNKMAYVLIVDFQPQFLGYDENGKEQQRTPVYLYRYVFPDTEDHKDPIEIIHDALKKTVNPGTPTDGTLDQEFTEKNGEKIFYNCRLNTVNPGFVIGGVGSEVEEGIGVNVKFKYLILETQYSIDNNLFDKPYSSSD
ncbi:MAG: hypothetical protein GYA55_05905 [SAR324 cluster bacterium]|uniref:Uncharacterized protein n=1 Tax=SAR324 cluster bacterium TaxID=2024889 RepID=A0A7X9FR12_9DELT|nr:hypothetical protein [SAR324 cluster bacterium]